jgi:hypothetical protein
LHVNWYAYGARFYDPSLGRWHTQDPSAESYPSWSPYNYVLNNPIIYIDPFGLFPEGTGWITRFFFRVKNFIMGCLGFDKHGYEYNKSGGNVYYTYEGGGSSSSEAPSISYLPAPGVKSKSINYSKNMLLLPPVGYGGYVRRSGPNINFQYGLSGWMAPYSIGGGGLATPGRSSISPMLMGSDLVYYGDLSYQNAWCSGKAVGYLMTNDYYSNGSVTSTPYYGQIGPGGERLISTGEHTIYFNEMQMLDPNDPQWSGWTREGVAYYIDTHPNPSMEIHPSRSRTAGCIGVQETADRLLELYDFVYTRSRLFGSIRLYVYY